MAKDEVVLHYWMGQPASQWKRIYLKTNCVVHPSARRPPFCCRNRFLCTYISEMKTCNLDGKMSTVLAHCMIMQIQDDFIVVIWKSSTLTVVKHMSLYSTQSHLYWLSVVRNPHCNCIFHVDAPSASTRGGTMWLCNSQQPIFILTSLVWALNAFFACSCICTQKAVVSLSGAKGPWPLFQM